MIIKDKLHTATAVHINGKTYEFDAIECMINFLKTNKEEDFTRLQVANYSGSGDLIDARSATYLKSEAIPSPMGADISAFKSKKEALKADPESNDNVYSWEEIKARFKDPKFGAADHHDHHNHNRPDAHAPIGVMGDHLHPKGGLMVSLKYMNMSMDGNKAGTEKVNDDTIFENFMVAPQEMTMEMYMLGVMYAPSDKLTLMLMQSLVTKKMDLTARMMMNGMTMLRDFSTASSGFGDLKLSALYGLFANKRSSLHLNGTLNLPIGSIEERDDTPMMENAKLPYSMQLGSGTFDISLGATFKQTFQNVSWGIQQLNTIRTGENDEGYRFGNQYSLNIWGAYVLSRNISISTRFFGISEKRIKGADPELNPMMITTADTDNYGSDRIKSFLGVNVTFPKDLRIGAEAGFPIYERYNGIQMDEGLSFTLGLKYNIL